MFFRLKTKANKWRFNRACRGILDTAPVGSQTDGPVILSEVSNSDVMMYLVAVKSLYRNLGAGRIVLLLDRDCPEENLRIFNSHVRPWKILWVEDQVSNKCPIGGTWERILTIAQFVEDDYVIQVDSDTVTSGATPEVLDCVRENSSFMIGTWNEQEIEPVHESAKRASGSTSQHVQMLGERHLTELENAETLKYARGQSSFAGFAKGSFSVTRLEQFSQRMQALLGEKKWSEWGSESFASNFFVANSTKSTVLPYPKYGTYYPEQNSDLRQSTFLHFEGTNRFKHGEYIARARAVIDRLRS